MGLYLITKTFCNATIKCLKIFYINEYQCYIGHYFTQAFIHPLDFGYISTYIYIYVYIYSYIRMHKLLYLCITRVQKFMHTYVAIYVYIYVYIRTHDVGLELHCNNTNVLPHMQNLMENLLQLTEC